LYYLDLDQHSFSKLDTNPDPLTFSKSDTNPDLHSFSKSDTNPDPHSFKKLDLDPDPHKVKWGFETLELIVLFLLKNLISGLIPVPSCIRILKKYFGKKPA
jgi:hypothetical protein